MDYREQIVALREWLRNGNAYMEHPEGMEGTLAAADALDALLGVHLHGAGETAPAVQPYRMSVETRTAPDRAVQGLEECICGPLPDSALQPLDDIVTELKELFAMARTEERKARGPTNVGVRLRWRREGKAYAHALRAILGYRKHLAHLLNDVSLRASAPGPDTAPERSPYDGMWSFTPEQALRWALDYIADGDDGTPQHLCEFTTNPPKGACEFHEKYWAAREALDDLRARAALERGGNPNG